MLSFWIGKVAGPPAKDLSSLLTTVVSYDYSSNMLIRLQEWRARRGLSIRQLADRAGVGFATVHRIEAGRISPTVRLLEKLAEALEIHISDLLPPKPRQRQRRKTQ